MFNWGEGGCMDDLVSRLRAADKFSGLAVGHYWNLCEEAADEIERLQREVAIGVCQRDVAQAALIRTLERKDYSRSAAG